MIVTARIPAVAHGAPVALALCLLPLVMAACGKAGSNNEDDLAPVPLATFQVGGTLSGVAAGEAVGLRLEHDYSELAPDANGILRPAPRSESVILDDTRNGQFWSFATLLPAGTNWRVRVEAAPAGQVCAVSDRAGVMPDSDLVDIDVDCSAAQIGQPTLNDSGIDWCSDTRHPLRNASALDKQQGTTVEVAPGVFQTSPGCADIALTHPGQDGLVGRDAIARQDAIDATSELSKLGAGEAGFDFTKVSNAGDPLPPGTLQGPAAGDWACTLDLVTGLMWEVKVDDPAQLRHRGWTYTWYEPAGVNDGGTAGAADGGACLDEGRCDSEKFVADVNAAGLCGFDDWRLPTREELRSIMHYGREAPAVDPAYFPDTGILDFFWTRSPYAGDPGVAGDIGVRNAAWTFSADGRSGFGYKTTPLRIRLVRAAGGG